MPNFVQNIIIGAGPAGLSCALQLSRYNIDFKLFERKSIGGLLNNANLVENYLGVYPAISGSELVEIFMNQIRANGITPIMDEIESVEFQVDINKFRVKTKSEIYFCTNLICALGTTASKPDFEIASNAAPYVFDEIVDIKNAEYKRIVIIGSGDAAFDYALNLARKNQVSIIARGDKLSALPLLIERAKSNTRIIIEKNSPINKIRYNNELEICSKNRIFQSDIAILAIGRKPNDKIIAGISNKEDLISNKRLYLIGDINNGIYRQASISAANGLQAAMNIFNNNEK